MKLNKPQVDYSRGMKDSHCGKSYSGDSGYCRHFIEPRGNSELGQCERVSGPINRLYWCRLFAKAHKSAA